MIQQKTICLLSLRSAEDILILAYVKFASGDSQQMASEI